MLLATGNYYIDKYGREAGAEKMAKNGYKKLDLDLSDTNNEYYAAKDEEFIVKLLSLKRALSAFGVETLLARGPLPTDTYSKEQRALTFEKTVKAMVAVRHLGGRLLTVMPIRFSEICDGRETLDAAREYYAALAEVAKGLGVTLCIENAADGSRLSSLAAVSALVKEVNSPSLKLSVSVGAASARGEDFLTAIAEAEELTAVVRAEDSIEGDGTPLPLFEGNVNWAALAECLFSIAFSGALTVTAPICLDGSSVSEGELEALEKRSADYAALIAG